MGLARSGHGFSCPSVVPHAKGGYNLALNNYASASHAALSSRTTSPTGKTNGMIEAAERSDSSLLLPAHFLNLPSFTYRTFPKSQTAVLIKAGPNDPEGSSCSARSKKSEKEPKKEELVTKGEQNKSQVS